MADGMGHLAGTQAGAARLGEAAALCGSCHPLATPIPRFTNSMEGQKYAARPRISGAPFASRSKPLTERDVTAGDVYAPPEKKWMPRIIFKNLAWRVVKKAARLVLKNINREG